MARNGTFFGSTLDMGNNSTNMAAGYKQPDGDLYSFFTRLGSYSYHNFLPYHKKMAALLIKYSLILTNAFGIGLTIYWLLIDIEGIKVFVTSVGVFCYGLLKLYEKYLDIKDKKRKSEIEDFKFKQLKNKKS